MLVSQGATDDRHIIPLRADVNAGTMDAIFPYNMQALIRQNAVTTAAIKTASAKGALRQCSCRVTFLLSLVVKLKRAV